MKVKHIIIIFLLSYIFEVAGVHFKIMQLQGAPALYTTASVLKVISAILGIWKLFTVKEFSNFMNR